MKYVITIIILGLMFCIFAQVETQHAVSNNTGEAKSETMTLRFAIGQPAIGTRTEENIKLQSGYLLIKTEATTAPVEDASKPVAFGIKSISPNPFNASCNIEFEIFFEEMEVHLKVLDISGRIVDIPIAGERLEPGYYTLKWNGDDLASGTYFIRLSDGNTIITKRAILMK